MHRAIFLDRDGTINVDKSYLYRHEDFEFLPGAVDGLRALKAAGYLLVVATNQSGIARGYYTEEDYLTLERWFLRKMESLGAAVDAVYHCPHLPDAAVPRYRADCGCRKPALGMFEQAIRELDIDPDGSAAIGDRERDLAVCKKYAGMRGFLLYAGDEKKESNIECITGGLDEAARRLLGLN